MISLVLATIALIVSFRLMLLILAFTNCFVDYSFCSACFDFNNSFHSLINFSSLSHCIFKENAVVVFLKFVFREASSTFVAQRENSEGKRNRL